MIKGDEFFIKWLEINSKGIIDGINDDIKVWSDNLKYLHNEKEMKV